ncbi:MAG: response regulator [Candidatus Zixiibacteriota bacterium]
MSQVKVDSMRPNVLLVDDERGFLFNMNSALLKDGCRVTALDDGFQAMNLLDQEQFDVLVTDLFLPGNFSGLDLVKSARSHQPKLNALTITAYPSKKLRQQAEKLGVFAYLEKPVSMDLILNLVRKTVEGQRLQNEIESLRGLHLIEEKFPGINPSKLLLDIYQEFPFAAMIVSSTGELLFANKRAKSIAGLLAQLSGVAIPGSKSDGEATSMVVDLGGEGKYVVWKRNVATGLKSHVTLLCAERVDSLDLGLLDIEAGRLWTSALLKLSARGSVKTKK